MKKKSDLVGDEGAAHAGPLRVRVAPLRVRGDVRRVEGAVDDQLAPPLEQVFFFQAEDGILDYKVTGVQTCALPIFVESNVVTPSPMDSTTPAASCPSTVG